MNCNLISYDFIKIFWPKMSLKRAPRSSKSSPNFKIELRTSQTLFPSPEVELNELEHLKSRTFRTRTQVRSITNCVVWFSNISILNLISSLIWNSAAQLPNKFLLYHLLYVMLLWSMNVMSAVRPITKHQGASFALIRSRLLKQTRLKMMLVWWFRIKPRLSIWLGPSQLLIHKSNHPPIWLPLNWKLPVYRGND